MLDTRPISNQPEIQHVPQDSAIDQSSVDADQPHEPKVGDAKTEADGLKAENDKREAQLQAQRLELNNLKADMAFETAVLESGLQWEPGAAMLRRYCQSVGGFELLTDGAGNTVAMKDNERVSLSDMLRSVALNNPNLIRSNDSKYQVMVAEARESANLSKEDFAHDLQKRVDFINRHGLKAFEDLPLRRPSTTAPGSMTAEDYSRLSTREKASFVQKFGVDSVALIMSRRKQ